MKSIWYWQNMDNKIMMKILKMFRFVEKIELRPCNYKLSTFDVRKMLTNMSSKNLKGLTLIDQSQIDIGKLFNKVTIQYATHDTLGRKYQHLDSDNEGTAST